MLSISIVIAKTNPDMRQELAELGFIYEPQLSDKDNLQAYNVVSFSIQDRDYLLRLGQLVTVTVTFFESDRELTAGLLYDFAFQLLVLCLLSISPILIPNKSNFPIVYGDLLENLYQLLNTRTKKWRSVG